jgi:enterochelin esterase-like enzyme
MFSCQAIVRRGLALSLAFTLVPTAQAQTLNQFLDYLDGLSGPSARDAAVDSFWAQLPSVPWTTGDTAHFLYRGAASSLALAGDFNGWNPTGTSLSQASGTSLWHRSMVFESDARLDYKLVRNGSEWILDPANPATVPGGFGPNSELAMPAYVQPWEIQPRPGVPMGSIGTASLASTETGRTYSLQIYTPPGYDPERAAGYPVAYFQDGHEYVGLASAGRIMDNLIDSGLIEPLIGVFVRPTDRNNEYAGGLRFDYARFFAEELVPWADANYNTAAGYLRRAVIGPSFGGNISAIITMEHPEVFGLCGLHSGAFWPNSFDTYNRWLASTPDPLLKVAALWGSYEGSLPDNMHQFADALEEDNTEHIAAERHEGHSWGLWRSTLDDMLQFFFPPGGAPSGMSAPERLEALVCRPNPASRQIILTQPAGLEPGAGQHIALWDAAGQQVLNQAVQAHQGEVQLDLSDLKAGLYLVGWSDRRGRMASTTLVFQP